MQTVMVRMRPDDTQEINKIQSWAAWRQFFNAEGLPMEVARGEDGECIRCNGEGWINSLEYGDIRCICDILSLEARYKQVSITYRSRFEPKSLDDLQPWGDIASEDEIITTVDYLKEWVQWPDRWVHIQGQVGSGKSHMLTALACELGHWALYITAADLESRVFQALKDDSLEDVLDSIKTHPILLIDDLGADYSSGFPKSQLRKIIDYRYLLPHDYITVTTTNLRRPELRDYDMRISDRVLDDKIGHIIRLDNVKSWRTQHNANPK